MTLKKRSLSLMIPLVVITGGLYINYWCHRTARELVAAGQAVSYKRGWKAFNLISATLGSIDLLLSVAGALGQIEPDSEKIVGYLSFVSWGILAFQFRHILNYDLEQVTSQVIVGRFRTLFFNIFYLQYILNRIHKDLTSTLRDPTDGGDLPANVVS